MLEKISNGFADFIFSHSGCTEDKREAIEYGFTLFLTTALGVISILIISAVFFDIYTALVFLAIFIPLRKCSGGYHCETYLSCFILSNILFAVTIISAKASLFWNGYYIAAIVATLLSLLCILRYAPVVNKNNPINNRQQCRNRKKALALSLTYSAFIIAGLILFRQSDLGFYMCVAAYTVSVVALLIVVVKIYERRKNHV